MASNGLQSGYEDAPAFPEEDGLAAGADSEELARYAMRRGNSFKGTTAQRNAWVTDGFAREGHQWYDTTLDAQYVHNGSGFVVATVRPLNATFPPTLIQHGRTTITTDASGYFSVAFPTPFPNACDRVIATSASPGAYFGGIAINGIVDDEFSGRLDLNSATFAIDWIALGR